MEIYTLTKLWPKYMPLLSTPQKKKKKNFRGAEVFSHHSQYCVCVGGQDKYFHRLKIHWCQKALDHLSDILFPGIMSLLCHSYKIMGV